MSDTNLLDRIVLQDPAALMLALAVCLSAILAFALIATLAKRTASEDAKSRRDEYNFYVFLRESEGIFEEFYKRQSRVKASADALYK